MSIRIRNVAVTQLPEMLDMRRGEILYRELESRMEIDRPLVVLDCSIVRQMNGPAIHLLLCCLEEAMKRNGDVRLSALAPDAIASLEAAGVDRLFQVFHTTSDAVDSFRRPRIHLAPHECVADSSQQASENAA